MTPDDISHMIHEGIIMNEYDPDVVRSRIEAMLAIMPDDDETMGAVLHEARLFAAGRHDQFCRRESDMERMVAVMDGAIEPMIAWLKTNGFADARRHVFGQNWWTEPSDEPR